MGHEHGKPVGEADAVALALLSHADIGLIALDGHLRVKFVNEAALRLLGAEPGGGHLTLATLLDCAAGLTSAGIETLLSWLQTTGPDETMLRRHDGRLIGARGSSGPDGHVLLALTLQPRSAVPAARRDPLTGLADRAWFHERLDAMLAEPGGHPSVLLVDLEHFKAVNDLLGHPAGDAVLQVVGKRLAHALREADVICRLSGDEFAVIMPDAAYPEAVARRLIQSLSRPYTVVGETACIGASIGIATAPAHGRERETLLEAAKVALYAAKSEPDSVRLFEPDLTVSVERRRAMAESLRHAVPGHELELYYQPKIGLGSATLSGFEALIRWHHKEEGLLAPHRFLQLAEETGLIWSIGEWVLLTACEEATQWPASLGVSVNVSVKQLMDRQRLARMIKSVLLRTALAPERLEIEIPEEALTREAETGPVVHAIRALGVRVSVDDFGTGSTSLRQLGRFPLDKLKIDRTLVQGLGQSEEAAVLVRSIISVSRCLGVATVAEGVETEAQREWLRDYGCVEMQGFLVSQPLPASEVGRLIMAMPKQGVPAA